MSKLRCRLIFFLVFTGLVSAGDLKVFSEPRLAVASAKTEGKLIVFLLSDQKNQEQILLTQALQKELEMLEEEFVFANCSHAIKPNRDLFSERFGKTLIQLPAAVVTNSNGSEIAAYQGMDLAEFEKMLISSRIKGGKITDPVKLANLNEALEKVGENKGIFSAMVKDLKVQKVAITRMQDWKKKDGTVFRALLLEALGDYGVFVDEKGNSTRVKFVELSTENLEYLQTILKVE
jgi:hypothetical protein